MSPEQVAPGVIDVDGVWKRFRGDRRPRSFRDGPGGIFRRRGWRWALRDIDLHLEPGEALGLIGSNGSGKSTLLKILTQVMDPYAGTTQVGGKIGALIEIQAGLHPELTGRENVHLYGAFLGLPRQQVEERFDEIVAFAELETAIDRQSKFFSSGMRMRLGFAVAALLEPDVLLVDEVLAVGDASFQQRCLDRLEQAIEMGTTLVFVSHDLAAVESISKRVVWLDDGQIRQDGSTQEVLAAYRRSIEERARTSGTGDGPVTLARIRAERAGGGNAVSGKPLDVVCELVSDGPHRVLVHLGVSDGSATPVFTVAREIDLPAGSTRLTASLGDLPLADGTFSLWMAAHLSDGAELIAWQPVLEVVVTGPQLDLPPPGVARQAPVHVPAVWTVES